MNTARPSPRATLAAAALLLGAAALAPAGCGEQVLLGGGEPGPDPECMDLPCGAACILGPCDAQKPMCDAPAEKGFCDPEHRCVDEAPICDPPPLPCEGKSCGDTCDPTPCPPNAPDCPPSAFSCNAEGACVEGDVICPCMGPNCPPPPPLPCQDEPCGSPCDPCQGMGPPCMKPPFPTACDGMLGCIDATKVMCP